MENKKIKVSELSPEKKEILVDVQRMVRELMEKYGDPKKLEPKPKLVHAR